MDETQLADISVGSFIVIGIDAPEEHARQQLVAAIPLPKKFDRERCGALPVRPVWHLGFLRELPVFQFQRGVNVAVSRNRHSPC